MDLLMSTWHLEAAGINNFKKVWNAAAKSPTNTCFEESFKEMSILFSALDAHLCIFKVF